MPRTARASVGGICYHVINRGNARQKVFHKNADYEAFLKVISDSLRHIPMRIISYALMPNHFHLVLWPREDGDLSRWMQRVTTAHVRRYHQHYDTIGQGHLWQGRFKAFPIQADNHLLTVLRYVERNPLRAKLVDRAEQWPWTSLPSVLRTTRSAAPPDFLHPGPFPRPDDWLKHVNRAETQSELQQLHQCVNRGTPCGSQVWINRAATRLALQHTIRPRGRPRK